MATFTIAIDGCPLTRCTAVSASAFTSGPIREALDALSAAVDAQAAAAGKPAHIINEVRIAADRAQEALNTAYADYAGAVERFNQYIAFDPGIQQVRLGEWMHEVIALKAKLDAYATQQHTHLFERLDAERERARRHRQPPPELPPPASEKASG